MLYAYTCHKPDRDKHIHHELGEAEIYLACQFQCAVFKHFSFEDELDSQKWLVYFKLIGIIDSFFMHSMYLNAHFYLNNVFIFE